MLTIMVLLLFGLVFFMILLRFALGFFMLPMRRRMYPGYFRPFRRGIFWRPWLNRRPFMGGSFYGRRRQYRGW